MADNLFHRPVVLYQASAERKDAAWAAFALGDYVLAMYLAGLAVESILQAIALNDRPIHDAKHDLTSWLGKCRASIQDILKSDPLREHWSRVVRVWCNELRYLSRDGLLGYMRKMKLNRGIPGGPDDIMKSVAKSLLDSASMVHSTGVAAWARYTGKS